MANLEGKTDSVLGHQIKEHLARYNVESPIDFDKYESTTSIEKIEKIKGLMEEVLDTLGFDLSNDSVEGTPRRMAKMWVNEIMQGLDYNKFPRVMTFSNTMGAGAVFERGITSMSLCSHHLVTIDGKATVAYVPKDKVIGLSKLNRVVEFFSRRPQEAERLTLQIYHALQYILDTDDIAVHLTGTHMCVKSRGVGDLSSDTATAKLGGSFLTDSALRSEFYQNVRS